MCSESVSGECAGRPWACGRATKGRFLRRRTPAHTPRGTMILVPRGPRYVTPYITLHNTTTTTYTECSPWSIPNALQGQGHACSSSRSRSASAGRCSPCCCSCCFRHEAYTRAANLLRTRIEAAVLGGLTRDSFRMRIEARDIIGCAHAGARGLLIPPHGGVGFATAGVVASHARRRGCWLPNFLYFYCRC